MTEAMTAGARRAVIILFAFTFVLATLNFLWTSRQVNTATTRARALCRFDADLGTAPVTVNPATHKPSLLGIAIVSDARVAWHQAGCDGRLPAPDPGFAKWAAYYKLPVN